MNAPSLLTATASPPLLSRVTLSSGPNPDTEPPSAQLVLAPEVEPPGVEEPPDVEPPDVVTLEVEPSALVVVVVTVVVVVEEPPQPPRTIATEQPSTANPARSR